MIWPFICVDNFFEDPLKVKEFAYSLKYFKSPEGRWPGLRTEYMHEVNYNFFNYTTKKIISLIYPINSRDATWFAEQTFQRIPGNLFKNKGWIHTDANYEFTAIIYLSDHKNCGTSIYKPKNLGAVPINEQRKRERYLNINEKTEKEEKEFLKENNDQFEKTLEVPSIFNRLIIFDAANFHAAENFHNENIKEDRLTLITFFKNIQIPNIKYPIPEMRRI
jgi:hypothetical protein